MNDINEFLIAYPYAIFIFLFLSGCFFTFMLLMHHLEKMKNKIIKY